MILISTKPFSIGTVLKTSDLLFQPIFCNSSVHHCYLRCADDFLVEIYRMWLQQSFVSTQMRFL